tara:strand:- start:200 stop:424 length:225 start_codon:yes stop_codon:yes gene_type:complete
MKDLTKEQIKELNRLTVQIVDEASIVKMDYEDNPSNLDSGSIIVVHQNSSLLNNKQEKLGDVAYNITQRERKDE